MSSGRETQPIKPQGPIVPCPPYAEQLVRRTLSQQPSTRAALATATRMRYKGLIQGFLDSAERFASPEALWAEGMKRRLIAAGGDETEQTRVFDIVRNAPWP